METWDEHRLWTTLCRVAETEGAGEAQTRAMAGINAMRLCAVADLYKRCGFTGRLDIKQLQYSKEYSKRNIVLQGATS